MSAEKTYEEYLNEQLINCLNLQTNVIQNLAQHSQFLSLQLIDIKSNVELLANRIVTLQQQSPFLPSFSAHVQIPPNPLLFSQSGFQILPQLPPPVPSKSAPFSFSSTVNEQPSRNDPFVFGPLSSSTTTTNYLEDEPDSDQPINYSERIIDLVPVEVKTGEEDENILFCERARLYRFDASTNEMKERGIGEMKILQHKTSNVCRVLMRREHVLKVCANHRLTSQMELNPHQGSGKTYIWSAMDSADGEAKHETLCIKFKTDEQAKNFATIFNDAKTNNRTKGRAVASDDNDIVIIGEIKPTLEQMKRARKLQLPMTFYLYENKEPCRGCRGCREDFEVGTPLNSDPTLESLLNFPSAFFPNSSLSSIISKTPPRYSDRADTSSSSPPKEYRMIIKAKRCLPGNRLPPPSQPEHEQITSPIDQADDATTAAIAKTHQKKLRNFSGQNNTPPFSLDKYASEMADNILDRVKNELSKLSIEIVTDSNKSSISANSSTSIFGSLIPLNPTNNSGFSFTNFGNAISPKTTFQFATTTPDSSSNFLFGNTPKISFADLVKQSSDNQSTTDKNETRGQGSLLFGGSNTEDTDGADDSYEPMKSFKPIVHLLPVEVKTGEEDENILFCERAKLFRFDAPTHQMKERGIGEMKILQHKTTNRCRVLMRREQVFKVCANHKLTPQLELKEHVNKENAYIWSAMDYADGVGKAETLCVRFKTNDQAKRFFQQFNDAKLQQ